MMKQSQRIAFGGVRIIDPAKYCTSGRVISGFSAACELVDGVFDGNDLGGAGLMSDSVFGRLAGTSVGQQGVS